MSAGSIWVLAGIVLCGAELLSPGVFLLWIGLAAIAAGALIAAGDLGLLAQIAVFLVLLSASLSAAVIWQRRGRQAETGLNAPGEGLVGKSCRALAFTGREGRVTFRDGTWPARMAQGSPPAPGDVLRIVGLDGTTLVVTPD